MSDTKQSSDRSGDGLSRRGFLGTAAVAAAGLATTPSYASNFHYTPGWLQQAQRALPNSKFGNVQIGTITYSYRSLPGANNAEQVLNYIVLSGISSVELMDGPIMQYLGAPSTGGGGGGGGAGGGANAQTQTPEQQAEIARQRAAATAELNRWYASPPMEKVAALKKMFNDAGVNIHLTKLNIGTPEAADFGFRVARALGARGNSTELPTSVDIARMHGAAATRHGVLAAYHQHLQPATPGFSWDPFLAIPGVALNIDVGHYYAATGRSAVPEIIKYHDRIVSIHLKDRTAPVDGQDNLPWGTGATPIGEILRLIHRENYNINADAELEYPVPADSNALIEMRKCVDFAREVLTTYVARLNRPATQGPGGGGGAPGGGAPGGAAPAPGGPATTPPAPR